MDPTGLMYERSALCVIDDYEKKNKNAETTSAAPQLQLHLQNSLQQKSHGAESPETTDPHRLHLGQKVCTKLSSQISNRIRQTLHL